MQCFYKFSKNETRGRSGPQSRPMMSAFAGQRPDHEHPEQAAGQLERKADLPRVLTPSWLVAKLGGP